MLENFKTDIIYYNCPTDFEMEFNLCGCCRMRLLNDKCSDKKSLLISLSRAVSRSRIIAVIAPLFSEDNITSTIASAIGTETEVIKNSDYNISSQAEIKVLKNSVPLVTANGIFGGCLIQSGPQTLILLTDNKDIRKSIMQNLIHPYIQELAVEDLKPNEVDTNEVIIETDTDPAEAYYEEDALAEQIILEDTDDGTEYYEYNEDISLIIDEDNSAEDDNSQEDEIDDLVSADKELFIEHNTTGSSDDDYSYDDYYIDEPETAPSSLNIWFIAVSIVLLITVAVLCYCIFYVPTKAGIEPAAYVKDVFNTMFG